ncbi:MAG: hypothetical protein ACRDIL_02685 [Candidatus Limnocylindrales bacterium]
MRRLLALAVVGAIVVGCIPPRPSPVPSVAPTASVAPAASATPVPSLAPDGVTVDSTLLALLPAAVGGVPLVEDAETAAAIAAEGSIAPFVSAIALARAFGPQSTDTAGDYVVATVARLRPGTFGSIFYRGWRDTFDAAVCEQAGGVDGHAEADIAGHQTFIGTCAGGVHTYHVHLPASDVIVSMQAAGDGRYGERVVEGLTE